MEWRVFFFPEFIDDLEGLSKSGRFTPSRAREKLADELHDPFKAERFEKTVRSGSSSSRIDRLHGSEYPPSHRFHLFQDYRATSWCWLAEKCIWFIHAFSKSADPNYRKAVRIHDKRLESRDIESFKDRFSRDDDG